MGGRRETIGGIDFCSRVVHRGQEARQGGEIIIGGSGDWVMVFQGKREMGNMQG